MELDTGDDFSLKDVKSSIESIMKTLNTLSSNREDDNILLLTLTSQVQLQGHRVKQIEGHVKEHLPVKHTPGDVSSRFDVFSSHIESRLDQLSNRSDHLIAKIEELANENKETAKDYSNTFNHMSSQMESRFIQLSDLSENIMNLKIHELSNKEKQLPNKEQTASAMLPSEVDVQVTNLNSKLDQLSNLTEKVVSKMDNQAYHILRLGDKVEKMTLIESHSKAKLEEETIKQAVKESEAVLKQEMTNQTTEILKDNIDIKEKLAQISSPETGLKNLNEPTVSLQGKNKEAIMPIEEIRKEIKLTSPMSVFTATQSLRKLLSVTNPPIDKVVEADLVDTLVNFLGMDDKQDLQFEAAWILTNIASGTSHQTQVVINNGAVKPLIRLLNSSSMGLVEQCVWAIRNIAGDGPEVRNLLLSNGVVQPLIKLLDMTSPPEFLQKLAVTFSNLCRAKKSAPKLEYIKAMLPALSKLIHHTDTNVISASCWALSYITEVDIAIQEVLNLSLTTGVCQRLMNLLSNRDSAVVASSLRAIGNIVAGTYEQTKVILDLGILHKMPILLSHPTSAINEKACWMLSNILCDGPEQIKAVVDHRPNLLPMVVSVLSTGDFESQKEAAWFVAQLMRKGTVEQKSDLREAGYMTPLYDLVIFEDTELLKRVLDGFCNVLATAEPGLQLKVENLEKAEILKRVKLLSENKNILGIIEDI